MIGYWIGFPGLANKNTEHPLKFEFQVNNFKSIQPKYFKKCSMLKSYSLFFWNSVNKKSYILSDSAMYEE